MARDISSIAEPPADPSRPKTAVKKSGQRLELPVTKSVAEPAKVSPRVDWEVIAQLNGYEYGPFTVYAVDESEAITRLLDGAQGHELRPHALSLRYKIARKAA